MLKSELDKMCSKWIRNFVSEFQAEMKALKLVNSFFDGEKYSLRIGDVQTNSRAIDWTKGKEGRFIESTKNLNRDYGKISSYCRFRGSSVSRAFRIKLPSEGATLLPASLWYEAVEKYCRKKQATLSVGRNTDGKRADSEKANNVNPKKTTQSSFESSG